jgi:hypothetical protein
MYHTCYEPGDLAGWGSGNAIESYSESVQFGTNTGYPNRGSLQFFQSIWANSVILTL